MLIKKSSKKWKDSQSFLIENHWFQDQKNIVTHMLSFKILTLICYANIIKMFIMIINLQISHISHIQGTRLGETSHFDNTKYNHIYVFVNCCI